MKTYLFFNEGAWGLPITVGDMSILVSQVEGYLDAARNGFEVVYRLYTDSYPSGLDILESD